MSNKKAKNTLVVDQMLDQLIGKEIIVTVGGQIIKGVLDSYSDEAMLLKNEPTSMLAVNVDSVRDIVFRRDVSLITYKV